MNPIPLRIQQTPFQMTLLCTYRDRRRPPRERVKRIVPGAWRKQYPIHGLGAVRYRRVGQEKCRGAGNVTRPPDLHGRLLRVASSPGSSTSESEPLPLPEPYLRLLAPLIRVRTTHASIRNHNHPTHHALCSCIASLRFRVAKLN